MLKKIVVLGPESTGKSTLCEQLAAHYKTIWCREYAREYLLKHGTAYSFDDLLTIAKGQLSLEDRFVSAMVNGQWPMVNEESSIVNRESSIKDSSLTTHHSLLFIDTNMYVMKVWCEYVFGKCHQFILDEIVNRKYDLYLLCNIDLPWVADELREYPDEEPRKELYQIYKNIMINQQTPWVDISGSYEERLEKAIIVVDKLLKL